MIDGFGSLKHSSVFELHAMFDGYSSMETGHDSEARTVWLLKYSYMACVNTGQLGC